MCTMRNTIPPAIVLGLLVAALSVTGVVRADAEHETWQDGNYAYDRARRALGRGEVLPMAQLLRIIRAQFSGEVLDVQFEREDGQWVYEFKILQPGGKLLEVYVNAKTGQILSVEDD